MIIPDSVAESVARVRALFSEFQREFNTTLTQIAEAHKGIYEARPEKTLESIADKIQLFEGTDALVELRDLSAGSIIVPTVDLVSQVSTAVGHHFQIDSDSRSKPGRPEDFAYDDTHLILKLRDRPELVNKHLLNLSFELQIKTYLQYAWSRVVHDFVYKAQEVSWGKARMVSQIRAMLELADLALAKPENAAALLPATQFPDYERLNAFIKVLRDNWPEDRLPANMRRAAYVVRSLVEAAKLSTAELDAIISRDEFDELRNTLQITPLQAVFIALYKDKGLQFVRRIKERVLITREMELFYPELREVPQEKRVRLEPPLLLE